MDIPTVEDVRKALEPLSLRQLGRLAELSGVPVHTIYKIRRGETVNPGIDTVGQFAPHIAEASRFDERIRAARKVSDRAGA